MSNHDKVNKSNNESGWLTLDELARELNMKAELARAQSEERAIGKGLAADGAPDGTPRRSAPEE